MPNAEMASSMENPRMAFYIHMFSTESPMMWQRLDRLRGDLATSNPTPEGRTTCCAEAVSGQTIPLSN
ncbi:MAG: hypothetical protein NZ777_06760, partial [Pseudomonadales bacterium]|nr:hypothetical protein [Pseudomonadales bacterium]